MGNLSALRDWGHARDYIEIQWLMMQQQQPEECVIATGVQVSAREFVQRAAAELGITVAFSGDGQDEAGTVAAASGDKAQRKVGDMIVRVDPRYFRPTKVEALLGDAGKAKRKLDWTPATTLAELVSEMVASDYAAAKRDSLVNQAGFRAPTTTSSRTCRRRERRLSITTIVGHFLFADAGTVCKRPGQAATITVGAGHRPCSGQRPAQSTG